MATINQFEIRDQATIRDAILRVIRNGLIQQGVANPNVTPNSDYYLTATAIANELAVVEANAVIKVDEQMPDTAAGPALDRWLNIIGAPRRGAAGAVGNVTLSSTASCAIISGTQLVDSAGQIFQVTVGGVYANGSSIPVAGTTTGVSTNHLNGDVLTWVIPPAFANPTVTVGMVGGTDGLTNGISAEDDPTGNTRLLSVLGNPPAAGNSGYLQIVGAASSPVVQKVFVYPALQGPASASIVVCTYSTAALAQTITGPSANRDVSVAILNGTVAPYITGLLPEYAALNITTVTNVPTDVSFGLSLPSAPTASIPGPGGGWLDGTPWPAISGTANNFANVTAVTSTTVFTVNAPTAPTANVSRVAFLNPTTWLLYTAKVVSFTGAAGAYVLTVDTPMVGIAVGNYVFPQSVNQQAYVNAALIAFGQMGPGELTANPTALQRAYRHPLPQFQWPYTLGAQQLRILENVGPEVLNANYYATSTTTPAVPGAVTSPPNILVPRNLAFYPI